MQNAPACRVKDKYSSPVVVNDFRRIAAVPRRYARACVRIPVPLFCVESIFAWPEAGRPDHKPRFRYACPVKLLLPHSLLALRACLLPSHASHHLIGGLSNNAERQLLCIVILQRIDSVDMPGWPLVLGHAQMLGRPVRYICRTLVVR